MIVETEVNLNQPGLPYDYELEVSVVSVLPNPKKPFFNARRLGFALLVAFASGSLAQNIADDLAQPSPQEQHKDFLEKVQRSQGEDLEGIANWIDDRTQSLVTQDIDVYCSLIPGNEHFLSEDGNEYTVGGQFSISSNLPKPSIFLKSEICRDLVEYVQINKDMALPADTVFAAAESLRIIAHELAHANGQRDETLAECTALETFPIVAEAFAVPELATSYEVMQHIRANSLSLPVEYRTVNC